MKFTLPALLLATCYATAGPIKVGFGDVDVTPNIGKDQKPVFLAGFGENRRATGVHDPIMARAIVLDDGKQKIAMVSVDVVGLFHPVIERVRKKLPGIDYVLVSATHNHEGPDTLGLWGPNPFTSGIDKDYLNNLEDGCVKAVQLAVGSVKDANSAVGQIAAGELLRDARKPEIKHDTLSVISFTDPASGKPSGLLVQWNNHPEDMDDKNTLVTADFVGVVVKQLKEKYGCPVVYFTGTVGGLMTSLRLPVTDAAGKEIPNGSFERLERYSSLVTAKAVQAIEKSQQATLTPFSVKTKSILLPMENMLYRLAWQAGTLSREMYEWNGDATPKEFKPTKDVSKPVAAKTELGLLRLGEVEIAVIPGEIYPELVIGGVPDPAEAGADYPDAPVEPAIYNQLTAKYKMLIGLGNDELGYFVPKRQWDEAKPFCYGLKSAQYGEVNSVGPSASPIICGEFKKLAAVAQEKSHEKSHEKSPEQPVWLAPILTAVDARIATEKDDLLKLYKHLHANPELSYFEEKSGQRMAEELRQLGFTVTEKVGGYGVVGVLKNGPGPTVLVRTDTDALPVVEKTGLSYASTVRTKDKNGNSVGAMHACGHDMHMACWVGTARVLKSLREKWAGTLVFIAQPAEEVGAGARMMMEDGLLTRFPKPDYCLALHCDSNTPIGQIRYNDGLAMANVDSVDLLVKGKGGHGAAPHTTVDPIVLSARIIVDLQTIVSRETNPTDPVVVTVGSIHGGTKHNIIPNEVKLQLTVRTTNDATRERVLKAIDRIAKAAAEGANAPAPQFKVALDEYTPALVNDSKLTLKTVGLFKQILGEENVRPRNVVMGGEDFGRFTKAGIPACMYFLGTVDPIAYKQSLESAIRILPSTHNDQYAPIPEPSLTLGVRTMTMAVMNLVGKN
jgi:hippurate hydrolase